MLRTSIALVLLAASVPAFADTRITFVDDKGATASQLFVKGGKVLVQGREGQGTAIYDTATNSMKVLMPAQKKYMVFDQQSAAQMGAMANNAQQQATAAQSQMAAHQGDMDKANADMQAKLASMPPEQRAMVEKMMAARGGMGAGPASMPGAGGMQVETKDLGTSETVAGHACKDMQLLVNGKPSATMCVMDSPDSLGIPAADMKTLEAMRDGMQKIVSQMGPMGQGMASMMSKGFAIKSTKQHFDPKTMKTDMETDTLKSVSTGGVDAALFNVPADYTETTMQEMMQGGH
jgi:hypothetical protein